MAINYELLIQKLEEANSIHANIVDRVRVLQSGFLFDTALTATQIVELEDALKDKAKDYRDIAQEIKVITG